MSSIVLEDISPKTGSTITLNGNVFITGSLNGYPFGSFTGNTPGSCVPQLYVENINDCGSGININDDVKLTGEVTATTYYGDSSNMTKAINNVIPVGSGITSVNAYLNYGFNLISTANTSNYCVRLPQTPIQGREVSVVNNSGFNIYVFPSISGGSINGIINGNSVIPSDGRLYSFFCYENPSPGAWSSNMAPAAAAGVYDSGEISMDMTNTPINNFGTYFGYVSALDDNFKNLINGPASSNYIDMLAWSPIVYNPNPAICGFLSGLCGMVLFVPVNNWDFIDKITVYTNFYGAIPIISGGTGQGGSFGLNYYSEQVFYQSGTTNWINTLPYQQTQTSGSGSFGLPWYANANQKLPGTSTHVSGYTANAGDPGTWYGELIYSAATRPSQIGKILLSSGTMDTGLSYIGGQPTGIHDVDYYHIKYISFWFQTWKTSPLVKFKFLIEYS